MRDLAALIDRATGIVESFRPKRVFWRFTVEEDLFIEQQYLNYTPIQDIARVLGRSYRSVAQRIQNAHPNLRGRRGEVTRLVRRHGKEFLSAHPDLVEAARITRERKIKIFAAAKVAAAEARAVRQRSIIETMHSEIRNGIDRNRAIFNARAQGIQLEKLAAEFGVTRERVRQICEDVAYAIAVSES